MKITFISHAALLIETEGIAILSDPWWNGPSFAQQWWNYPRPAVEQLVGRKIDYIYISHGHNDHLHPETLQTLCRDAVVLVSASSHLAELPRELGFAVREIAPNEEAALTKRVRVRLMPTHSGDTLLAVSDGEEVCINLNDALHSAPRRVQDEFLKTLRSLYPKIDYVFCGYAIASHFPNCYRIAGKDQVLTAQARQRYFTAQWVRIVAALSPRFAFPFAGDVVLLEEDLLWVNELTHNAERPPEVLKKVHPEFTGQAIDPGPGFKVADARVVQDIRRPIVSEARIRQDLKDQIERAQRYEPVEWREVEEIHGLLVANIATCSSYLQSFDGDYRCLVRFRNSNFGVVIRKQGKQVTAATCRDAEADSRSAQLVFSTRLAYLKSSLTIPYADEVIFVGSGGIFEFKRREDVQKALHRELAAIVRRHDSVPVRGAGTPRTLKSHVKRFALKLLGREDSDLYDLDHWTVYSAEAAEPERGG
jgi:hypothetical protein